MDTETSAVGVLPHEPIVKIEDSSDREMQAQQTVTNDTTEVNPKPATSLQSNAPTAAHMDLDETPQHKVKVEVKSEDVDLVAGITTTDTSSEIKTVPKIPEIPTSTVSASIKETHNDPSPPKEKSTRRSIPKNPTEFYKRQREQQEEKDRVSKRRRKLDITQNQAGAGGAMLQSLIRNDENSPHRSTSEPIDVPVQATTVKAKDDMIKKFIAEHPQIDIQKRGTNVNEITKSRKSFGFKKVGASDSFWSLKGMKTLLCDHQLIGAGWMIERECLEEGPFGGILADEMGLGKTVQALAVMVGNPPVKGAKKVKTTLVVVPRSLKYQWLLEAELHTKLRRTIIYSPGDMNNNTVHRITANDIVIAPYSAVLASFKENRRGLLHQVDWHRIVLDEAHNIKNLSSQITLAVIALRGQFRWALSGTPIQNCYEEFYPLFCFLKHPLMEGVSSMEFNARFCKKAKKDNDGNEAAQDLGTIVSNVMMRRTYQDQIMGKRLIPLDEPYTYTLTVKPTQPEQLVIQFVEKCFADLRIQRKAKTLAKESPLYDLSHGLQQITRLRQLVANPDLVHHQIEIMSSASQLESLRSDIQSLQLDSSNPKEVSKAKSVANSIIEHIDMWSGTKKLGKYLQQKKSIVRKKHHCHFCEHGELEDLVAIKGCNHCFCKQCLGGKLENEMTDHGEVDFCPKCRQPIQGLKPLTQKKQKKTERRHRQSKKESSMPKRATDNLGVRPSLGQKSSVKWMKSFDASKVKIIPSAKLDTTIGQIRDWKVEAPEDKIVVFTSWSLFAIMIGAILQKQNIKFVYYSGDMNDLQRNAAIKEFKDVEEVHVMIMMLKCGSIGLNLTWANRAIVVDLWWNLAAENQAFGRIHRMGQTKKTYLVKIIVEGTIDKRIHELQQSKLEQIGAVMQDSLSQEDRAKLLGCNIQDNAESMDISDDEGDFVVEDNMDSDSATSDEEEEEEEEEEDGAESSIDEEYSE